MTTDSRLSVAVVDDIEVTAYIVDNESIVTPVVGGPPGAQGPAGPPGPPGSDADWVSMTQAAYDALPAKDPSMLYVIIG